MKYRLLDVLACAQDHCGLRLENAKSKKVPVTAPLPPNRCTWYCGFKNRPISEANVTIQDCTECYSQEIVAGELVAECGKRYPIRDGIPRILSTRAHDFMAKNRESFSLEWKYSRLGERNWGQDINFRRNLFLKGFGTEPKVLPGKLMLDAGCGSGLLSMDVAKNLDLEVVGIDLASGIELAYRNNQNPRVHFVQGSILEPPLRSRSFDLIYCAGVLIHLPDTKQAFDLLPRVLKVGGRYFVWIYHPIGQHEKRGDRIKEALYHRLRTHVTSKLPIRVQEWLYLMMVVPFLAKRTLFNLVSKTKNDRTWREKMQNFVDTFSPPYVNRHTEAEVLSWFREQGFRNETVSYRERYGFGVRGDLFPERTVAAPSQVSSRQRQLQSP